MCIRLAAVVVAAACGSSPRPPTETSPAKPEPSVTTAAPRPPRANVPKGSGTYGTAHPTYFRGFDTRGKRWMALCQARRDTDGDGKIEVSSGHHGGLYGDDMALYLVIGGGEGTVIEALVSRSDDDRWLAILRDGTLELVDVETGDVRAMVDADVESDERPGAPHRAATFVGERLLYIRHYADKDTLVVYDLASRKEREITVPDRLWRIVWSRTLGRIYTVPRGQGFPKLQTTLDPGECTGPFLSYSTHGQSGPTPTERRVDLDRGAIVSAPANPDEPTEEAPAHEPKLAGDNMGPARW